MKPWSKLWRKESPRFRALKLLSRMLASYVLKFVDEDGRLPMGRRDVTTAVALAVGADVGDRRWLRPAVEMLIEHGYLVVDDDHIVVVNYPKYQDETAAKATRPSRAAPSDPLAATSTERESNASRTRDAHERDASRTRVERETRTNATRVERESDARIDSSARNHTVAQDVLSSESEGRGEKGEERRESAHALSASAREVPPAVPARDPSRPVPKHIAKFEAAFAPRTAARADAVSFDDVAREFSELRRAAGGGTYKNRNHQDDAHLDAIVDDANGAGASLDERLVALRAGIEGLLADEKAREAGYPIGWLARDPARYRAKRLAAVAAARGVAVGADTPLARAQAAHQRATEAMRRAREKRDAIGGGAGYSEAAEEFRRCQAELRRAGDELEAAEREAAA